MAKTQIVELYRKLSNNECCLWFYEDGVPLKTEYCWKGFKRTNPVLCRNMRPGQNRKLKRTQLKNGFKLERL